MRAAAVIEIILVAALVFIGFMLFQEADENVYYSGPSGPGGGSGVIETQVPLIEENARWGKTYLSVYIDAESSSGVSGFRHEFIDAFREAAVVLSDSVSGRISFRFVGSAADSDVSVRWVERMEDDSLDAIGHTELNFSVAPSFNVINRADIKLLARKEGRQLSERQMFALSLHELGHAIGLGHSDSKSSMMFPEAQEMVSEPSHMDVQSIIEAYALEALPDLYVREAEFSKRVLSRTFLKSYLYDGKIAIINDGLADSGRFSIIIEAGGSMLEENAKSLGPGESMMLTLQNVTAKKDFSQIIMSIDKENSVRELDESNEYAVDVG